MIGLSGSTSVIARLLPFPVQALLAFGAGALYPLAFAPFHGYPLLFLSVALFFWLLVRAPAQAGLLAWFFGLGKYAVGVSWIYVSVHQYGGASSLLAGALVTGFVAFMALFSLPIGWFVGLLKRRQNNLKVFRLGLGFIGSWVLMEWLLTWFLTGFPWLFAGHAMLGTPLQGYAPIFGVLGVSLLTLGCGVAVVVATDGSQTNRFRGYAVALPLLLMGTGAVLDAQTWTQPAGRYEAALVQGNIDQAIKWNEDQRTVNVRKHLQLSEKHWNADVLVWPEFALTLYGQDASAVTDMLHQRGQATATNVIVGMPDLQWQDQKSYQIFNVARGLGLATGQFAKHHLVPFGDYVPLQDYLRGVIEFFDLPMSGASRGARQQANIAIQLATDGDPVEVATGICYEIAYGDTLRRHAVNSGVLLTLSNDTWFGHSIGPHQHMQIAQMRALENGRWMLRATNSGLTGIVNERGEITAQLPQFEAAVLRGEFVVMHGRTLYSYLGDWPALGAVLLLLFVGYFGRPNVENA